MSVILERLSATAAGGRSAMQAPGRRSLQADVEYARQGGRNISTGYASLLSECLRRLQVEMSPGSPLRQ